MNSISSQLDRDVRAGKDARFYFPSLRGYQVGNSWSAYAADGKHVCSGVIKALGRDGHDPYFVADAEYDIPKGQYVFHKHWFSALNIKDIHNRSVQDIVWTTAKGQVRLYARPDNGDFMLEGKNLCLNDHSVTRQTGLSGTAVAANNLRGIDVPVPAGAKQVVIKFATPEANAVYFITVSPYWETKTWIKHKRADGFTVAFSDAPTEAERMDWQLIR